MTSAMTTARPTTRTARVTLRTRRPLRALALAVALAAIPIVSPLGADAYPMSENTARNHCANAGGSMHYDFMDEYLYQYDMTCTLPSGSQFTCTQFPDANGTYLQNNVDCS